MMYLYNIFHFALLSLCTNGSPLSNHQNNEDNPQLREKYAQFHCYKLRICTPGGARVCGYDMFQTFLAEFEDMCTFHKVNCMKKGYFQVIDPIICKDQKNYFQGKDANLTSVS